jgi:hypothetical protein
MQHEKENMPNDSQWDDYSIEIKSEVESWGRKK